jgi:hypothetical protein
MAIRNEDDQKPEEHVDPKMASHDSKKEILANVTKNANYKVNPASYVKSDLATNSHICC